MACLREAQRLESEGADNHTRVMGETGASPGTVFISGSSFLDPQSNEWETNDTPGVIKTLANTSIVDVSLGSTHMLFCSSDGTVHSSGYNQYGQLGLGSKDPHSGISTVSALELKSIKRVSAGLGHSVALDENGLLYSWGNGEFGQLGLDRSVRRGGSACKDADLRDHTIPRPVKELTHVVITQIACGDNHTLALSDLGTVYSWGDSSTGATGLSPLLGEAISIPTILEDLYAVPVCSIKAGSSHSLALTACGSVYSWGSSKYGQLGQGGEASRTTPPHVPTRITAARVPDSVKEVSGMLKSTPWTDRFSRYHIVSISAGPATSAAVTSEGYALVWGRNKGLLGIDSTEDQDTPVLIDPAHFQYEPLRAVSCGSSHMSGLTLNDHVYTWGHGHSGQLGHREKRDVNKPKLLDASVFLGESAPPLADGRSLPFTVEKVVSGNDTTVFVVHSSDKDFHTYAAGSSSMKIEPLGTENNEGGHSTTNGGDAVSNESTQGTSVVKGHQKRVSLLTEAISPLPGGPVHVHGADPSIATKAAEYRCPNMKVYPYSASRGLALSSASFPLLSSSTTVMSPSMFVPTFLQHATTKALMNLDGSSRKKVKTMYEDEMDWDDLDGDEVGHGGGDPPRLSSPGDYKENSKNGTTKDGGGGFKVEENEEEDLHWVKLSDKKGPNGDSVPTASPLSFLIPDHEDPSEMLGDLEEYLDGEDEEAGVDHKHAFKLRKMERFRRPSPPASLRYDVFMSKVRHARLKRDFSQLIQYIQHCFSSPAALNGSFLPSINPGIHHYVSPDGEIRMDRTIAAHKDVHNHPLLVQCGLDVTQISNFYHVLLSLNRTDVNSSLLTASQKALKRFVVVLKRSKHLVKEGEVARMLLILLQNPMLSRAKQSDAYMVSDISNVHMLLSYEARNAITEWMVNNYPVDVFGPYLVETVKKCVMTLMEPQTEEDKGAPSEVPNMINLFEDMKRANDRSKANRIAQLEDRQNPYLFHRLTPIQPEDFYLSDLIRHTDIAHDFFTWGSKILGDMYVQQGLNLPEFTFCAHNFVLDPFTKSRLLRLEQALRMMFQGMQPGQQPLEVIRVRRDHLLEDSKRILLGLDFRNLMKQLKVEFIGEEGVDAGGVQQEFHTLLCHKLLDPQYGLFTYNPEERTYWFNPTTPEDEKEAEEMRDLYKLFGRVLGSAFYHGLNVQVNFPNAFYSMLLNNELGFEDLASVSPDVYRNLKRLLDYAGGDEEDVFFLAFEYTTPDGKTTVELKEGGSDIPVTKENKKEFVDLYAKAVLHTPMMDVVNKGFQEVCHGSIALPFLNFTTQEISNLLCGVTQLDFKALEENTRYEGGYHKGHPFVRMFWHVFHNELTTEQKREFLKFSTGSSLSPVGGLGKLNLVIQRAGPDSEMLPSSHTCFFAVLVPEYSSAEKLKTKLLVALRYSEGFGLQ